MLLTNLEDVQLGMRVGASVMSPRAPDMVLLQPGAEITTPIIERLRSLGVVQLWVEHHLTADLDAAVAPGLSQAKLAVYNHLKRDLSLMSQKTVSTAQIHIFRRVVIDLVQELVANRGSGITDQLFTADSEVFSHSSNVAYLSALVGIELEAYLIQQRPRLSPRRARDVVALGLAGMLHDVGKISMTSAAARHHEVLEPDPACDMSVYGKHPTIGYKMLRSSEIPATSRQAVLNHHQRFDGTGWSDLARNRRGRRRRVQAGRRIHIFTRIVSVANVLDNLLRGDDGSQRPPVAALYDLASPRFDGWFDPVVRRTVLRCIPPFAVGSQVGLSNERAAVVTAPNLRHPCRPTVRLLEKSAGSTADQPITIDLVDRPELRVVSYAGMDVEQWLFELPAAGAPEEADRVIHPVEQP